MHFYCRTSCAAAAASFLVVSRHLIKLFSGETKEGSEEGRLHASAPCVHGTTITTSSATAARQSRYKTYQFDDKRSRERERQSAISISRAHREDFEVAV